MDTVEGELRGKSKRLAQQAYLPHIRQKSEIFATFSPGRRLWRAAIGLFRILTIGGFFDTLKTPTDNDSRGLFIRIFPSGKGSPDGSRPVPVL